MRTGRSVAAPAPTVAPAPPPTAHLFDESEQKRWTRKQNNFCVTILRVGFLQTREWHWVVFEHTPSRATFCTRPASGPVRARFGDSPLTVFARHRVPSRQAPCAPTRHERTCAARLRCTEQYARVTTHCEHHKRYVEAVSAGGVRGQSCFTAASVLLKNPRVFTDSRLTPRSHMYCAPSDAPAGEKHACDGEWAQRGHDKSF